MPKISTSARHSSHQDGKEISKHRGHQYRDVTKARKLKQTRFKGIVESGKTRPLERTQVIDMVRVGRKMQANHEKSQPVAPIIPVEVYSASPVNANVPRVIIPTSQATAKRKQATATNDDGDTTDVDDSENLVGIPAGCIEVAEMLLNPSPLSSGPRDSTRTREATSPSVRWMSPSEDSGTSQSSTTVPEITKSTSTQSHERPVEEPSSLSASEPICQNSPQSTIHTTILARQRWKLPSFPQPQRMQKYETC